MLSIRLKGRMIMNTRVTISPESGGQPATSPLLLHNLLLVCGIASSVLYILTVELAAFAWEGYDANAYNIIRVAEKLH
jgi:hypothetical protein